MCGIAGEHKPSSTEIGQKYVLCRVSSVVACYLLSFTRVQVHVPVPPLWLSVSRVIAYCRVNESRTSVLNSSLVTHTFPEHDKYRASSSDHKPARANARCSSSDRLRRERERQPSRSSLCSARFLVAATDFHVVHACVAARHAAGHVPPRQLLSERRCVDVRNGVSAHAVACTAVHSVPACASVVIVPSA